MCRIARSYVQGIWAAFLVSASICTFAQDNSNILHVIEGGGGQPTGSTLPYFDQAQGYLAEPQGEGPHGAIILIHEWDGLVERVKQVADALAAQGYIALAADLYSGRTGANRQENMALVQEARGNPETLIANLNAAVSYLKARPDSNGLVATIGWCFGGGVALSFALGGEHHDGTAIFYGQLLTDPEELAKIDHEIFGTFAGQDRGIPVAQVDAFVAALNEAGIPNDIHIYDPVQHGFWLYVERDPETNLDPARDTWDRLSAYFKRNLETADEAD